MVFKSLVIALVAIQLVSADIPSVLEEFNNAFAEYSSETTRELQSLRSWNSAMIKGFNEALLIRMGGLVLTSRASDAQFLEEIQTHEGVSETCREHVLALRETHLSFQNGDIRQCAHLMWTIVETDSQERFWPEHNSFDRENTRAISDVSQILATENVLDEAGLRAALQDELEYFRNLRANRTDLLWEEIEAHVEISDGASQMLERCSQSAAELMQTDHTYIRAYLEYNCGGGTTTPEPTTEGTETTAETSETTEGGSETPETTEDVSETTEGATETTEGGSETPETTEGTSETTEEGSETPETTEGTPETTEGGPETTEGASETTEGGSAAPETTEQGSETTEGAAETTGEDAGTTAEAAERW